MSFFALLFLHFCFSFPCPSPSFSSCSSSSHLNINTRNTRLNYAIYYLRSKRNDLTFFLEQTHGMEEGRRPWRASLSFPLSLFRPNKEKKTKNASSLLLFPLFIVNFSAFHMSPSYWSIFFLFAQKSSLIFSFLH